MTKGKETQKGQVNFTIYFGFAYNAFYQRQRYTYKAFAFRFKISFEGELHLVL